MVINSNNLVSQPTADCLEIPNSRAKGSFRCRSHSPLPSLIRVSLYGISLLVAVWLLTRLVARIKRVFALLVLLFASRPGCTLCSQSAFQYADFKISLAPPAYREILFEHFLSFLLSYEKPDIFHKIKDFGKSSQTQPTYFKLTRPLKQVQHDRLVLVSP